MINNFSLKYCTKCVIPNSRPDINFDKKGICSACNNAKVKKKLTGQKKEKNFSKY